MGERCFPTTVDPWSLYSSKRIYTETQVQNLESEISMATVDRRVGGSMLP